MSRRTIVALAASVIFGMGFILTVSTEASAYYRGGVYRGGVYRGVRITGWLLPGRTPGSGGRRWCCCGRCCRGRSRRRGCLLRARLLCATASSLRILSLPSVLLTALSHRRF